MLMSTGDATFLFCSMPDVTKAYIIILHNRNWLPVVNMMFAHNKPGRNWEDCFKLLLSCKCFVV